MIKGEEGRTSMSGKVVPVASSSPEIMLMRFHGGL